MTARFVENSSRFPSKSHCSIITINLCPAFHIDLGWVGLVVVVLVFLFLFFGVAIFLEESKNHILLVWFIFALFLYWMYFKTPTPLQILRLLSAFYHEISTSAFVLSLARLR